MSWWGVASGGDVVEVGVTEPVARRAFGTPLAIRSAVVDDSGIPRTFEVTGQEWRPRHTGVTALAAVEEPLPTKGKSFGTYQDEGGGHSGPSFESPDGLPLGYRIVRSGPITPIPIHGDL